MSDKFDIEESLDFLVSDNRIQYDSIESAVEAQAQTYSFNIGSELFHQLPNNEQRNLWRKEIEDAVKNGAYLAFELIKDERYNKKVEDIKKYIDNRLEELNPKKGEIMGRPLRDVNPKTFPRESELEKMQAFIESLGEMKKVKDNKTIREELEIAISRRLNLICNDELTANETENETKGIMNEILDIIEKYI
jgi:hypothetical protein